MAVETRIQLLIVEDTEFGRFQDAVYYTPEEHMKMTPEEREAACKKRVDDYVASMQSRQVELAAMLPDRLREDIEADLRAIELQKAKLELELTQVEDLAIILKR